MPWIPLPCTHLGLMVTYVYRCTVVDKVVSKATGKVYARKRIRRKTMFGHDAQAQKIYENELHNLKMADNNDHLIRVRGTYTDKKYLVMLLEPVADGNLKQFMDSTRGLSSERRTQLRTYFGCLAHTIAFLHTSEVLHKDIKPENILLKYWHLILTDFGTAFDWSKTGQSMTRSNASDVRTPRYQSPEVANAGEFHRSSDIWSLEIVFLEMGTILRGHNLADMNEYPRYTPHCSSRQSRASSEMVRNLAKNRRWLYHR
jgi:serine/threonine protein kinase